MAAHTAAAMTAHAAPLRASGPGRMLIQVRRHQLRSWVQRARMRPGGAGCSTGDTSLVYLNRFSFLVSRFSFLVPDASGDSCVSVSVVRSEEHTSELQSLRHL